MVKKIIKEDTQSLLPQEPVLNLNQDMGKFNHKILFS